MKNTRQQALLVVKTLSKYDDNPTEKNITFHCHDLTTIHAPNFHAPVILRRKLSSKNNLGGKPHWSARHLHSFRGCHRASPQTNQSSLFKETSQTMEIDNPKTCTFHIL